MVMVSWCSRIITKLPTRMFRSRIPVPIIYPARPPFEFRVWRRNSMPERWRSPMPVVSVICFIFSRCFFSNPFPIFIMMLFPSLSSEENQSYIIVVLHKEFIHLLLSYTYSVMLLGRFVFSVAPVCSLMLPFVMLMITVVFIGFFFCSILFFTRCSSLLIENKNKIR